MYFGENLQGFSLVDAKTREFNYPKKGASNATTRYRGTGGVELSSWLRRAAFALRFNDFNMLISGQVTPKTKVLYLRDILDRVKKAAPFLKFDIDPYAVIADGHLVWLLDGYTTSDKYPYSESFDGAGGLSGSFNYVRNSVKATVDAYNGTIKFYVVDKQDPVIQAYREAFPQLFSNFSDDAGRDQGPPPVPAGPVPRPDRRVPRLSHDQPDDLLQQGRPLGGLARSRIGRGRGADAERRPDADHDERAAGRVVDREADRPDLPVDPAAR